MKKFIVIALFLFLLWPAKKELQLEGRSSQWREFRNQLVEEHPYCAMCGAAGDLQVHHKMPYHLRPELELVRSNCCVLCRWCHFHWGHDPDGPSGPQAPSWSKYNAHIDNDIEKYGVK